MGKGIIPPPPQKINMFVEQVDTAEPPQRPRITTRPRSKTVQEGAIVEMTCIAQVVNSRAQVYCSTPHAELNAISGCMVPVVHLQTFYVYSYNHVQKYVLFLLQGSPYPDITWWNNRRLVTGSRRITVSNGGQHLRIQVKSTEANTSGYR